MNSDENYTSNMKLGQFGVALYADASAISIMLTGAKSVSYDNFFVPQHITRQTVNDQDDDDGICKANYALIEFGCYQA